MPSRFVFFSKKKTFALLRCNVRYTVANFFFPPSRTQELPGCHRPGAGTAGIVYPPAGVPVVMGVCVGVDPMDAHPPGIETIGDVAIVIGAAMGAAYPVGPPGCADSTGDDVVVIGAPVGCVVIDAFPAGTQGCGDTTGGGAAFKGTPVQGDAIDENPAGIVGCPATAGDGALVVR